MAAYIYDSIPHLYVDQVDPHILVAHVQKMVSFQILWQDMQIFSFIFNKISCLKVIRYAIQGNKVMVKLL